MEWNKDEVMDVFAKCERLVGKPIVNDALTFDYEDDIWFVAGYDGTIYACMFNLDGAGKVTPIDWELFSWAFARRSEQVPADLLL